MSNSESGQRKVIRITEADLRQMINEWAQRNGGGGQ